MKAAAYGSGKGPPARVRSCENDPHGEIFMQPLEVGCIPLARLVEVRRPPVATGVHIIDQLDKRRPIRGCEGGRSEAGESAGWEGGACNELEHPARYRRPDAGQQLQHTESRNLILWVLGPAQQSQQVLDMGGLEEFQAAKLDEGNVASN